jgi:hypothetical protein
VPHVFEPAASGRARCRGCGQPIARGEIRFGERLPNPFADGEMTLWFHPTCAAYKRPEPLLEALGATPAGGPAPPAREEVERTAQGSLAHRRLPRVDGAERAPSGQARCRSCRETIERGAWRVRLVFYEEGRFSPGGFVHPSCCPAYFEGHDVVERVLRFSPDLSAQERAELARACGPAPDPAP